MANTEHLPIFKRAYDLCLYLDQVVRSFPRYHKYGLGADLRDCARTVLRLVVRANSRRERVETLLELRETVEELKVLLRLACDAKAFPMVEGALVTPDGRNPLTRTIWFVESGEEIPRFVTAYPVRRRSR